MPRGFCCWKPLSYNCWVSKYPQLTKIPSSWTVQWGNRESTHSISQFQSINWWWWSLSYLGLVIERNFNYRFEGGHKTWILDGTKSLQTDGTYSRVTQFWAAVRKRAIELLQRDVIPGFDYALTEIVHCKSHHEIGVEQAQEQCVQAYSMRILELAKARVIVVLGTPARKVIQREFEIPPEKLLSESIEIGGNQRLFTFLPHPNARANRSFAKCLQNDELERLRAFLRHNQ